MLARRLVTGNDEQGRSHAVSDGYSPGRFDLLTAQFDVMWSTVSTPPPVTGDDDPADVDKFAQLPAPGGINWVVLRMPPQSETDAVDHGSDEFIAASSRFDTGGTTEPGDSGWHRTNTLDFAIVISGEIDLELDDGVHRLGPGDCVVQRATRHRWRNPGEVPCILSGVLISGESAR